MPTLDSRMVDRGPIPDGMVNLPLMAAEASNENMLVTWGSTAGTVSLAGATDEILGWTAGKMVADEMASIYPVNSGGWWKCLVNSASSNIYWGETVEAAGSGQVKNSVSGSGNTIVGKAMSDGVASGYMLVMPIACCPSAQTS